MSSLDLPSIAASVFAAAALLLYGRLWWQRARPRRQARLRARRAQRGERDAESLLRTQGYRILERQVRLPWRVRIDGEPVSVELRADLLVERRGRRLVAEVKTGRNAPSPDYPTTRRQLLEYRLAFDVDGVLLVDPERERIHTVEFPHASGATGRRPARWAVTGALIGAGAASAAWAWALLGTG